jgi:hypothetical protein
VAMLFVRIVGRYWLILKDEIFLSIPERFIKFQGTLFSKEHISNQFYRIVDFDIWKPLYHSKDVCNSGKQ